MDIKEELTNLKADLWNCTVEIETLTIRKERIIKMIADLEDIKRLQKEIADIKCAELQVSLY